MNDAQISGEQRLRSRHRKFYIYVGIAMLIGFAAGIGSGMVGAMVERDILPTWLLWIVWGVVTVAFAWFTRDYFRRIDELDLLDNLWASTIGIYVYVVVFGTWYFFSDLGVMGPMNHFWIFSITMVSVLVAYVARKLGWR